jgi:hypothetical protein
MAGFDDGAKVLKPFCDCDLSYIFTGEVLGKNSCDRYTDITQPWSLLTLASCRFDQGSRGN